MELTPRKLLKYTPVTLVTLIWGVSFIATKVVVRELAPFPAALIRFLIALMVLTPFRKLARVMDWNAFWSGFWGVTMYFVFENTALRLTAPTNVAVIVSSAPILYVLFSHIIHRQPTTSGQYVASALAFTGVALVILNGRLMKLNPLGDVLAFGSAVSWVFYTHYILKMGKHDGMDDVFAITFWGVVTLLPFSVLQSNPGSWIRGVSPVAWLGLVYLGVLCSALGYYLWNKSIALIGDRRTTNAIYFIPVVTILSENLVLGGGLTVYNVVGTALLILGLLIFERSSVQTLPETTK